MEEQKKNPAQGLSESEQVQVRRQKLSFKRFSSARRHFKYRSFKARNFSASSDPHSSKIRFSAAMTFPAVFAANCFPFSVKMTRLFRYSLRKPPYSPDNPAEHHASYDVDTLFSPNVVIDFRYCIDGACFCRMQFNV